MTQTPSTTQTKPKVAALIASRNRPDLVDNLVEQLTRLCTGVELDCIVVECGTSADKLSKYSTINYADPDFRGKCYGHNVALKFSELRGPFDYVWVLMNDVVFDESKPDPARALIDTHEANPRMGVLSPTNLEPNHKYPGGVPASVGHGFRPVTTCDYLGFMMKSQAIQDAGFLNPDFKFCWGAIHELSYRLYSRGWFVAYSDEVSFTHLGGSTYGVKGSNTITRDDYRTQAGRFAYDYFREHYADNWDELFWSAAQRVCPRIETNTYTQHKNFWSRAFTPDELELREATLKQSQIRCELTAVESLHTTDAFVPEHLVDRINALHPWFMPVNVGGVQVVPGVSAGWSARDLSNRIACRQTTIVGEVAERLDLTGASVLELACNCGFFSARYVEHGATRVLGVEGRAQVLEQAELYWGANQFLPKSDYQFMQGNISDEQTWSDIRARGTFDVSICAGILYHVPNYQQIIEWMAGVTRNAMVIDTRVGDASEALIEEPGELHFNAIRETRMKIVPHLPRLLDAIRAAGFEPEVLPVKFVSPPGLRNVDDYNQSRAVTIFARRCTPFVEPVAHVAPVRLHLGCGPEHRAGWVNVDANPDTRPQVVSRAEHLPMFEDASVDEIEACHLFEHFCHHEALAALREWSRVLKPGGKLSLELPNLERCIRTLGQVTDKKGVDLGLCGIFGYPPAIETDGVFQVHKWGWTPQSLGEAMKNAGFTHVREEPVTQTWRPATRVNRDMRLCATRPAARPHSLAA